MDTRNLSPWNHPQSAERAARSKAAAFVRALAEARDYATRGALPEAFAAPAAELYAAVPQHHQQQKAQGTGRKHKAGAKARVPIKSPAGSGASSRGPTSSGGGGAASSGSSGALALKRLQLASRQIESGPGPD